MGSDHLRKALKILGYTNKSLADELTSFRQDDLRTSIATVSRWVSGAMPADPGLLMYLRERLASHLIENYKPRLPQPVKVAIGGGKGGSGASTVSLGLAVAASDIGYRVALLTSDESCNAGYALAQQVSNFYVAPVGDLGYQAEDYDFVFVDLPARTLIATRNAEETTGDIISQPEVLSWADLLVLPVNLTNSFERDAAIMAFEALDAFPSPPTWMPVQCGMSLDLPEFASNLKDFEFWARLLCRRPIVYSDFPLEITHNYSTKWEFVNNDSSQCFYEILEDIAERLSISLHESMSLHQARSLTIEELVDRFDHRSIER